MLRMVKELVTRTSLLIEIYGAPGGTNCRDDEHSDIVDAFAARDGDKVAMLMQIIWNASCLTLTLYPNPEDLFALFRKSE